MMLVISNIRQEKILHEFILVHYYFQKAKCQINEYKLYFGAKEIT